VSTNIGKLFYRNRFHVTLRIFSPTVYKQAYGWKHRKG